MITDEPNKNTHRQKTALTGYAVNALYTAGAALSCVVTAASDTISPYIQENRRHNTCFDIKGFIHDQTSGDAAQMRMGYHHGYYNGCGWIAAYNAAIIAGISAQPADIIEYLEKHGGILLNGLLGVNPVKIRELFKHMGAEARIYYLPREADGIIKQARAGILMYAHKKGMHYTAVCPSNGRFLIFNDCAGENKPASTVSVDSWLKRHGYKHILVALITI